jgi:hypothetical protein
LATDDEEVFEMGAADREEPESGAVERVVFGEDSDIGPLLTIPDCAPLLIAPDIWRSARFSAGVPMPTVLVFITGCMGRWFQPTPGTRKES